VKQQTKFADSSREYIRALEPAVKEMVAHEEIMQAKRAERKQMFETGVVLCCIAGIACLIMAAIDFITKCRQTASNLAAVDAAAKKR